MYELVDRNYDRARYSSLRELHKDLLKIVGYCNYENRLCLSSLLTSEHCNAIVLRDGCNISNGLIEWLYEQECQEHYQGGIHE